MKSIRWYGPTLVLLLTVLVVMIAGPGIARNLAYEHDSRNIALIKDGLEKDTALADLSEAYKKVAKVVEPGVVHIQVYTKKTAQRPDRWMNEEFLRKFFGPHGLPPGMTPPDMDNQPDDSAPHAPKNSPKDMDRYNVPRVYGTGSGWVYDAKGHIITNFHVVDGADKITVRFHDGSERTAKLTGQDPKTDVAVIQVDDGSLHPAEVAEKPVEQGEIVFAFGSPFGFRFSMSQGIVSAKGRDLGILRESQGYENFIQTDAAINPGNSGGPLTNIYGQVVGMNTAIASRTGSFNGLGFAIPVDMVKKIADELITKGKVSRGYLGIYIHDLDEKMAQTFNFTGKGVLVEGIIEDGPAGTAGIKRGDIIAKVDGIAMSTAEELRNYVANIAPGKKVQLEVFRNGKPLELAIAIGQLPDQVASAAGEQSETIGPEEKSREVLGKLGFENVVDMSQELADRYHIKFTAGVLVVGVRPDSIVASEGIGPRAIITDVMGTPVRTVDELVTALNKQNLKKGVRISVIDRGQERFAVLNLSEE